MTLTVRLAADPTSPNPCKFASKQSPGSEFESGGVFVFPLVDFADSAVFLYREREGNWAVFGSAEVHGLYMQPYAKMGTGKCAGNGRELW